eukprot:scaffold208650_cov27-Tisochrysis_lutea.AAC.4
MDAGSSPARRMRRLAPTAEMSSHSTPTLLEVLRLCTSPLPRMLSRPLLLDAATGAVMGAPRAELCPLLRLSPARSAGEREGRLPVASLRRVGGLRSPARP